MILNFNLVAQSQSKRALFLGNSYTFYNDLPQLVADVALSAGDTLVVESNTQGGYTLEDHSNDQVSIGKIEQGGFDFVVLQEQSQLPSFPIEQVETDVYPYAKILDSLINLYNPCAETIFYMTWGRMNGDYDNCPTWPPVCTYQGMDSLLNLRYKILAETNNAFLSPVGEVWKYVRENYPLINLYNADESHPSPEGSYLAACTFYSIIFRKDPSLISYNAALSEEQANNIKNSAKLIVFDSLANWHVGAFDPVANFSFTTAENTEITFINTSSNSDSYAWEFGDGESSSIENPTYLYTAPGMYNVILTATKCGVQNSFSQTVNIMPTATSEIKTDQLINFVYPNPAKSELHFLKDKLPINFQYKIFNALGDELVINNRGNDQNDIDISLIEKGIYFLRFYGANQLPIGQIKFVKE